MKKKPFVIVRKCTEGYYVLLPAKIGMGIWVTLDNIDEILNNIYVSENNFIYGYKTMRGARKRIVFILTSNHHWNHY